MRRERTVREETARRAEPVSEAPAGNRLTFSAKYACPVSGFTIEEIEPRLFSFNNPQGACPHCDGLGARLYMDEKLVVPNEGRSIAQGAIAPWYGFKSAFYKQTLISLCDFLHISQDTPWKDLPEEAKKSSFTVRAMCACLCIIRRLCRTSRLRA